VQKQWHISINGLFMSDTKFESTTEIKTVFTFSHSGNIFKLEKRIIRMIMGVRPTDSSSHSVNIFKLQKRIIRITMGARPRDSCRELLKF
jgi:hypothetical protein